MDGSVLYLSFSSSLLLGFFTCFALFKFVKRWELLAFITLVSFVITFLVDKAFWGVAPFSNKYDQFMSVLSISEQLGAWYIKGLLYSSVAFASVAWCKCKHNKQINKD